jgi:hypothetical protein
VADEPQPTILSARVRCPAGHEFEVDGDNLTILAEQRFASGGAIYAAPVIEAFCPICDRWV